MSKLPNTGGTSCEALVTRKALFIDAVDLILWQLWWYFELGFPLSREPAFSFCEIFLHCDTKGWSNVVFGYRG